MNILILNWRDPKNPKSGGAEFVTQKHASAWVQHGHSVTWFSSSFPQSTPTEKIDGVTIIRRGGSLTTYLYAFIFYLKNSSSFDLVIDEIHGIPYFTPLYVRKPIIAFIHEVAGEIWDAMYPFPINILGKAIERFSFLLYKRIPFWTDAPSTIDDLAEKGIPRAHCLAIPCPLIKDVKSVSYTKEKHPTLIFVSRVVKMKGIEDILQSFVEIHKKETDARLWIIGTGEESYLQTIKEKVSAYHLHESVVFWGKVTEEKKYELLAKSHILLHASRKEGWGLVVLEAAIQGTPAIVYNVNGLKDVVVDGKTGDVTRRNTPSDMAHAALSLINDTARYQRYQKDAKKRAESFRWTDVTHQSLELLTKTFDSFTKKHE